MKNLYTPTILKFMMKIISRKSLELRKFDFLNPKWECINFVGKSI